MKFSLKYCLIASLFLIILSVKLVPTILADEGRGKCDNVYVQDGWGGFGSTGCYPTYPADAQGKKCEIKDKSKKVNRALCENTAANNSGNFLSSIGSFILNAPGNIYYALSGENPTLRQYVESHPYGENSTLNSPAQTTSQSTNNLYERSEGIRLAQQNTCRDLAENVKQSCLNKITAVCFTPLISDNQEVRRQGIDSFPDCLQEQRVKAISENPSTTTSNDYLTPNEGTTISTQGTNKGKITVTLPNTFAALKEAAGGYDPDSLAGSYCDSFQQYNVAYQTCRNVVMSDNSNCIKSSLAKQAEGSHAVFQAFNACVENYGNQLKAQKEAKEAQEAAARARAATGSNAENPKDSSANSSTRSQGTVGVPLPNQPSQVAQAPEAQKISTTQQSAPSTNITTEAVINGFTKSINNIPATAGVIDVAAKITDDKGCLMIPVNLEVNPPNAIKIDKRGDSEFVNCKTYTISPADGKVFKPGSYVLKVSATHDTKGLISDTLAFNITKSEPESTDASNFSCTTVGKDGVGSAHIEDTGSRENFDRLNWYVKKLSDQTQFVFGGGNDPFFKGSNTSLGSETTFNSLEENTDYVVVGEYYSFESGTKREAFRCIQGRFKTGAKQSLRGFSSKIAKVNPDNLPILGASTYNFTFDIKPKVNPVGKISLVNVSVSAYDRSGSLISDRISTPLNGNSGQWENNTPLPITVLDATTTGFIEVTTSFSDSTDQFKSSSRTDRFYMPNLSPTSDTPPAGGTAPKIEKEKVQHIELTTNPGDLSLVTVDQPNITLTVLSDLPVDDPKFVSKHSGSDSLVSLDPQNDACSKSSQQKCVYTATLSGPFQGKYNVEFKSKDQVLTNAEFAVKSQEQNPPDHAVGPTQVEKQLVEAIVFASDDIDNLYPGIIYSSNQTQTSAPFSLKPGKNIFKLLKKFSDGSNSTDEFVVEKVVPENTQSPEPVPPAPVSDNQQGPEIIGKCGDSSKNNQVVVKIENGAERPDVYCKDLGENKRCETFTNENGQQDSHCVE